MRLIPTALAAISISLAGLGITVGAPPSPKEKPPGVIAEGTTRLPPGWRAAAPRDELRPTITFDGRGGPKRTGAFVIMHDARDGLDGWVERAFPVTGGEWIRFRALRRTAGVISPRRSGLARIVWRDASGGMVPAWVADAQPREPNRTPSAEPEHPLDGATDADGWTELTGLYPIPSKATSATVELHLQWAANGRAEWAEVEFARAEPPPRRTVRLATVHHRPSGRSPKDNREEFAPLIAEAARRKADLVVLGETVPSVNVKGKPHESAEPIPGPTTEWFGGLARTHRTHIALSLYERDHHLIYNTAVLFAPDGRLIGRYRKTCLPHAEVEAGIAPGSDYPVFETSFGRVGLMVCYDGFFPEVARELASRGAEVIAWPVWGCDPLLARARAAENRVFVVSSAYMAPGDGWMLSAVYDRRGEPIAKAERWGEVALAEVELGRNHVGPYNLGDFRAMIARHRPDVPTSVGPAVRTRSNAAAVGEGRGGVSAERTPDLHSSPLPASGAGDVHLDATIENGSPVWWEHGAGGVINVQLQYDHERGAPNRAAGHIHFALEAMPGSRHTLEFRNLANIYNGRPGSVAGELKSLVTSPDGRVWTAVATRALPGDRVQLDVEMSGPRVFIARVEPYRLSDLDRWLAEVRRNPLAEINTIGRTVEGRELEMVRIGDPKAPHHVLVRARAHPWEAGGNWVACGLADRLLRNDPEAAAFRRRYCLWLMPMANKDGVARGRTRFNSNGMDLNRGWDRPADPALAPENHALQQWLRKRIAEGGRPSLALELHNDGNGKLHHARPAVLGDRSGSARLDRLESLLRKHTWFTEGSVRPADASTFTLADGLFQGYGIDAAVHEFNCHWIAGLGERPLARHWKSYGEGLARVLDEYFAGR